jgi:hypothetical protein
MSASNQITGPSTDNFTTIFNAATSEYQKLTGKRLDTHPFAAQLDTLRPFRMFSERKSRLLVKFSKAMRD